MQDEERRRKQQLEEIRKREAEDRAKQEEERRWREEERARREVDEKVHLPDGTHWTVYTTQSSQQFANTQLVRRVLTKYETFL